MEFEMLLEEFLTYTMSMYVGGTSGFITNKKGERVRIDNRRQALTKFAKDCCNNDMNETQRILQSVDSVSGYCH